MLFYFQHSSRAVAKPVAKITPNRRSSFAKPSADKPPHILPSDSTLEKQNKSGSAEKAQHNNDLRKESQVTATKAPANATNKETASKEIPSDYEVPHKNNNKSDSKPSEAKGRKVTKTKGRIVLLPCSSCRTKTVVYSCSCNKAVYCGAVCQKKHWEAEHQFSDDH